MKSNPVVRFFRGAWRVLDGLRRVVHFGLMLLVLLVVLAAFGSRGVPVPEAFVLRLDPAGQLTEQLAGEPVERAIAEARGDGRTQTLVSDLVDAVEAATGDPRVKAIHLDLDDFAGGSIDKLRRVSGALEQFRAAGKPVVASGTFLSQGPYYLFAQADEAYLTPDGGVFLDGVGVYRAYFAEALEKLSVDWHVFRTGDYKSFGETFTRRDMSEPEKEQIRPIMDGLWAAWRADVASARGIEPARVDRYIEDLLARLKAAGGDSAQAALNAGLVDKLWTRDQVTNRLAELAARDPDTGGYVGLDFRGYLQALDGAAESESGEAVGLIVATGNILPGDQPPGMIGGESLSRVIRSARQDPDVRALVLRVDSGGGSAFASEEIARELELVRQSGKPVIVSMGAVAASGGYMIALPADEIWAHPTTVTGSIGVFAAFPTFDRALGRLGVNVDGISTHRWSGDLRPDKPLSAEGAELIQTFVEGTYDRFLAMVAEARGMDMAAVRRIGGGRVWLGETGQRLGLVDKLGSLEDALDAAAGRAGLGDAYRVRHLEPPMDFGERLALRLFTGLAAHGISLPMDWRGRVVPGPLGELIEALNQQLTLFSDPRGVYMHCLCEPGR
ncbi:MAG: signal peptide peptidase SppA [Gammaproteobacteria bacterium]